MNHLRLTSLLFAIIVALTFLNGYADTTTGPSGSTQHIIIPPKNPTNRPNAPARIYLVAYYNAEYIDFIFPDGVSEITVEFVSPDHPDRIFSGTATIDNVRVPMPDNGGSYDMTCVTDTGISFYGRISF